MILEVERLGEDCSVEQRKAHSLKMAFKTPAPSWNTREWVLKLLHRGDHLDEKGLSDIFQKSQEENYFDFRISTDALVNTSQHK